MSVVTVRSERELPLPETGFFMYYVRLRSDPKRLCHGYTGDNYLRADGEAWEHDGYKFSRETDGSWSAPKVAHDLISERNGKRA